MAINWTEIYTTPAMAFADSLGVLGEIVGAYELRCTYIGYTPEEIATGTWPIVGDPKIAIGYVLEEYAGFIQTLVTYCESTFVALFDVGTQRTIYVDLDGTVYSGAGSISDGGVDSLSKDFENPDNWGWWVKRLQEVLDELKYTYTVAVGGTNPYSNASGWELFEDWTNYCVDTGPPEYGKEILQLTYPSPPETMGSYHSFTDQLGTRTEVIADGSFHTTVNRVRAWRTVDFGTRGIPPTARPSYAAYGSIKRNNMSFTRLKGRSGELADLTWQCIIFFSDPRLQSFGPDYEYENGDDSGIFSELNMSEVTLDPLVNPVLSKYQQGDLTFGANDWSGLALDTDRLMGTALWIREQINFPDTVSVTLPRIYKAGKSCTDYYYGQGDNDNIFHATVLRNNNPGAYDVGIVHYEEIVLP